MCGIAGLFLRDKTTADPLIMHRMTDAIKHRGPDAAGFFHRGPVSFGHRRLSIIDLSEKSNQPFHEASGRYSIIFNGEIYNYQEIKNQLADYAFQSSGDTEVVLAAYIKWGKDCFKMLKGMFAFAIWDDLEHRLILVRDRLGVKPLYYFESGSLVLFASEIRSILASELVPRKLDRKALWDYFAFQSFQRPTSIIEGINELPPGTFMEYYENRVSIKPYWSLTGNFQDSSRVSYEDTKAQLKQLLLQAVQRRMVSDVPVAAFLSGGIDSSAIVALMSQFSSAPETFNIAFEEKSFDESYFASLISKKYNTKHHKLLIKPNQFLDDLPEALNNMDTPSGDGINTFVVSKAIRNNGIKVALSGVGGDELFAGYPIFKQWKLLNSYKVFWQLPASIRGMGAAIFRGSDIKRQRFGSLLNLENFDLASVYPILRQINSDQKLGELLQDRSSSTLLKETLSKALPDIKNFPLLSQLTIAEYLGYTGQTLLKDTDQMSMAVSLEVREPFFDHDLIEYVLNIPDSFKIRGSYPKSLLLETMGDLIPREIYDRPKQGFVFPWKDWLKKELFEYADSKLKMLSARPYFNQATVSDLWRSFNNAENSVTPTHIMQLLVLEHYLEKHNIE